LENIKLEQLKLEFMGKIEYDTAISDNELLESIDSFVIEKSREYIMTLKEKEGFRKDIFDSVRRLDILQELLDDESITEIMVNGSGNIFIEKSEGIFKWNKAFKSEESLSDVIQRMVSRVNRIVNETSPIVDVRLEDGSRVNVVLPPVSLIGPVVTVRKFKTGINIQTMIESNTLGNNIAQVLKNLVSAGYNIFISGGTGSGKTTFLNALSEFIPEFERVITIEDSAELQIKNVRNLIRLETRNANIEGKNIIAMDELIKTALRMRPDRIVVGEVRGREAFDMLQAMNTGHAGMSTGHANSTEDMLSRLEAMVLMGADMPIPAIQNQIGSAIEILLHVERMSNGKRRLVTVTELLASRGSGFLLNTIYDVRKDKDTGEAELEKRVKRTQKLNIL
jgi:Flp pilus assembly protein, ATPase CpaF